MKLLLLAGAALAFSLKVHALGDPTSTSLTPANSTSSRSRPAKHVDTLNNTIGIYSTDEVHATKLRHFCNATSSHKRHCDNLQNHVSFCVDAQQNCTDNSVRAILHKTVDLNPCSTAKNGTLANQMCQLWFTEAKRCRNKKRRGPCAKHHVQYLLRQLRDFLDLSTGITDETTKF